jgi:hypothetical protein
MSKDTKMQKASVPKLARIVELLGGFKPLISVDELTGGRYECSWAISLNKGVILKLAPDEDPEWPQDGYEIVWPDINSPGHRFKSLHITLENLDEEQFYISVSLEGCVGDMPFTALRWMFDVPRIGWAAGEWYVAGTEANIPGLKTLWASAEDGDRDAREIAEEATEFDRENPIVSLCLVLVEEKMGAKA